MKKIMICTGLALGALVSSTAIAETQTVNPTANIIFKIGSVTYNGTAVGTLNINSDPTPTPTPVLHDHTFPIGESILTDEEWVNIIDVLNENADATGVANFAKSGSTWTVTCKPGYYWMADQNPVWGTSSESTVPRLTNLVAFNTSTKGIQNEIANETGTVNGYSMHGNIFIGAACWPEE